MTGGIEARVPVLVLDEGGVGELGLVRSLGLGRIPVHLVTTHPEGASAVSRYVGRVHTFPPPDAPVARRLDALRSIAASVGDRPPVMMAGDRTLELVSENREALGDVLSYDLATRELIATCLYKDRFAVAATEMGLPVPRTNLAPSLDHVVMMAPTLTYPVFVKPVSKELWEHGRLPSGVVEAQKGQRVDRAEELVALFTRLQPFGADSAVVQHFVASPDSEHYSVHAYVAPDGTFVGASTTRKIRVHPPHRGIGTCVRSEDVPQLVDMSRDVMDRLSYRGFALLQYKRDLASGDFLLLEINCRFSTSGELPARCGANFPLASYAAMTGQPMPTITQRVGVSWLDLEPDLAAMRTYRKLGESTWLDFAKSVLDVRYPAYLAWDDPRPFARRVMMRVRRRLARRRAPAPSQAA